MNRCISALAVLVLVAGLERTPAVGQVIERERDVKITGPRGRSIERSITTERGPGFVDRQVNIQRPGGSYHSEVYAHRPAGPAPIPRGGFGPPMGAWGFGRGPVIVEKNSGLGVGEALAIGGGMFGLGMLANSAINAQRTPPPVYAVPAAPAYVVPAAPPTVIYNQPQPYVAVQPQPQPAVVVVDPVADALARLQSSHDHSRRDGALTLGRLRDARAVPALSDRLKNDWSKEVRVAAATALGEIGDPRAIVPLERALEHDYRQDVRDAAALALSRFSREAQVDPAGAVAASRTALPPGVSAGTVPSNPPGELISEPVPPPPTPAYGPSSPR